MSLTELWEEGYIPAAIVVLLIIGLIGLYFLFQYQGWNMLWYWLLVGGLAIGTIAGFVKSRFQE